MNIKTVGVAMLAGAMIVGCGKEGESKVEAEGAKEDVMAVSVNGEKLMQSAVDADVAKVVAMQGDKIPADRLEYAKQQIANQIVQSFIYEKVLTASAKAAGVAVTEADRKEREAEFIKAVAKMPNAPKTLDEYFKKYPFGVERAKEEFDNGILIDKMIKAEMAKKPGQDYAAKAQQQIDNIVSNNAAAKEMDVKALTKLQELKAQLDKLAGAALTNEFAKLAKANSACPSSQKGGDLGAFTHGQMVKEFDEVAFKLPVNTVSEPVKTQFGYHLLLVTKKFPAVEAKDGKPAEPEKVQASHILIKGGNVREVPTKDDLVKRLEKQAEREFAGTFIQEQLKAAKLEASENYKHFLPVDNSTEK